VRDRACDRNVLNFVSPPSFTNHHLPYFAFDKACEFLGSAADGFDALGTRLDDLAEFERLVGDA
jgi:hypothetical protein